MTSTTMWAGTLTALSSIAHGGESRGTITLLRREQVMRAGVPMHVPLISGNSWRGRLRRIGEELMRDVLQYEGQIPVAAAHVLRGGGSLVKTTGEPLTGTRLREVRAWVPHFAIFGGSAGRTVDGALKVGKILPHVAETAHLTGHDGPPSFTLTQVETYTRHDEMASIGFSGLTEPSRVPLDDAGAVDLEALQAQDQGPRDGTGPMFFRIETFPAGTTFSTWVTLERVSDLQLAFFVDVLAEFSRRGRLGGRGAIGHGQFRADWQPDPAPSGQLVDWRQHLSDNRDQVMTALEALA